MNGQLLLGLSMLAASALSPNGKWAMVATLISFINYSFLAARTARPLSRDASFLLALLSLGVLLMYAIMFSLTDVKDYLLRNESDQDQAIRSACLIVQGLLLGASRIRRESPDRSPVSTNSPMQLKWLLWISWTPIAINVAAYASFFRNAEYVELHTAASSLPGLLMKSIYLTYAATIILAARYAHVLTVRRQLFWLFVANLITFAVLFQLRSPVVFYSLLLCYFFGHKLPTRVILVGFVLGPILLAMVALWRDPTLLDRGPALALLNLFTTFGDFADTLPFAMQQVSANGPSFGGGILGSLLGLAEPLANDYARSISEDYFNSGGGFGFFMPADLIANFGPNGAILAAIAVGWLLREIQLRKTKLAYVATSATLFATSLALVRNDIGATLRGCAYTVIATLLVELVVRGATRPTSHRPLPNTSHP